MSVASAFLSYATKDRTFVEAVADELGRIGGVAAWRVPHRGAPEGP